MKKYSHLTLLLVTLSLLNACSNTDKRVETGDRYYLLDTSKVSQETAVEEHSTKILPIKLLPVSVSAYLDQPGLVLRESNHRISVAQNHLWAESLKDAARRALLIDLNRTSNGAAYVTNCISCDELTVSIVHFYPTTNGEVELAGFYTLSNVDYPRHRPFSFSTALEQDGYEHAVMKMRKLLTQLASEIAGDWPKR